MRKRIKIPLTLCRETIRHISAPWLGAVVGGKHITAVSIEPACNSVDVCATTTCPQSHVL